MLVFVLAVLLPVQQTLQGFWTNAFYSRLYYKSLSYLEYARAKRENFTLTDEVFGRKVEVEGTYDPSTSKVKVVIDYGGGKVEREAYAP